MFYTVLHFLTLCCSNTLTNWTRIIDFTTVGTIFIVFFTVLPLKIVFLCNVEKISGANDFVLSNIFIQTKVQYSALYLGCTKFEKYAFLLLSSIR